MRITKTIDVVVGRNEHKKHGKTRRRTRLTLLKMLSVILPPSKGPLLRDIGNVLETGRKSMQYLRSVIRLIPYTVQV